MDFTFRKATGSLILVGAIQFILSVIVAEALYKGYSTANNYISDLGVGPSAAVFNSSISVFGLLLVAAAYLIWRDLLEAKMLAALVFIAGVGTMGVGVFTENAGRIHWIMSLIAFLFGALSAIAAYKVEKPPLNFMSVIMGTAALTALILFGSRNFLGLGNGGMERMIAYPIVLWAVAFGGHLVGHDSNS